MKTIEVQDKYYEEILLIAETLKKRHPHFCLKDEPTDLAISVMLMRSKDLVYSRENGFD